MICRSLTEPKGKETVGLAPRRTAFGARCFATHMVMASLTHFLTNEASAAPCSFLSAAWAMQAVFSHLVMKLVLAAPASFLSVAWVMQASSAKASVGAPAMQRASAASASVLVMEFISRIRPFVAAAGTLARAAALTRGRCLRPFVASRELGAVTAAPGRGLPLLARRNAGD